MARLFFSIILLTVLLSFSASKAQEEAVVNCQYELLVKTGDFRYAGTRATINIVFNIPNAASYPLANLAQYGYSCSGSACLQTGRMDVFKFPGPCRPPLTNACSATVSTDASGRWPDWFLSYMTLKATFPVPGAGRVESTAIVNKWLGKNFKGAQRSIVINFNC